MQFKDFKFILQNEDLTSLCKKLGYVKVTKLQKAIDVIIKSKRLDIFLDRGYYDGLYSSNELILALCKALNVDLSDELALAKKLSHEKSKTKGAYIYVETSFKIITQPIFVLAMASGARYISLFECEELYFKSLDKKLEAVSKIVKLHFKKQNGNLPIFGKISGYKVKLENKEYSFSTSGKLVQKDIVESVAKLTLKGKSLTSIY